MVGRKVFSSADVDSGHRSRPAGAETDIRMHQKQTANGRKPRVLEQNDLVGRRGFYDR
jgi:hypothetical protein